MGTVRAFSSEVDTGSREENAAKQGHRAFPRFGEKRKCSSGMMGGLGGVMSNLAGRAMDFVLPPLCLSCNAPVVSLASLCGECWSRLTLIDHPRCDVLGIPFPYASATQATSVQALSRPPLFHRAVAAVVYDDVSAKIVHGGKYGDRLENLALMSRLMAQAGRDSVLAVDLVVPVPLHWRRLWKRRYNQAAILARNLAMGEQALAFAPDVLRRIRPTAAQASLDDPRARRRNMRNAFVVPQQQRDAVAGKRIMLVDDVMTTGATVGACTKALLAAGVARVDVLVFALVLDPARIHI